MQKCYMRALAAPAAGALVLIAAGPGFADHDVAHATARAGQITIAGEDASIVEEYAVSHDGETRSRSGSNEPLVAVLAGQDLANIGMLYQDADAWIEDEARMSGACSGLAGEGATAVEIDDATCLEDGEAVTLDAGALNLTGLTLLESVALDELLSSLGVGDLGALLDQAALQELLALAGGDLTTPLDEITAELDPLLAQVATGAENAGDALGDPGVFVDLGAVGARCDAEPGAAFGDSMVAEVGVRAEFAGEDIPILNPVVSTEPNTPIVGDLSGVLGPVVDEIQAELTALLGTLTVEQLDTTVVEVIAIADGVSVQALLDALEGTAVQPPTELQGVVTTLLDDNADATIGDLRALIETLDPTGIAGLEDMLDTLLVDALGPYNDELLARFESVLTPALDEIRAELEAQLLDQLSAALAPLQQNVLDGWLNSQWDAEGNRIDGRTGDYEFIEVTALELQVVPALAALTDTTLLDLEIGNVTCGPNDFIHRAGVTPTPPPSPTASPTTGPTTGLTTTPTASPTTTPTASPTTTPTASPTAVPTSIPAGVAATDGGSGTAGGLAVGGLLALAAGAGAIAYRRSLT